MIWVPSHGKHQDWSNREYGADPLRKLNHIADEQASLALKDDAEFRNLETQAKAMQLAYTWADNMLERQLRGVTLYMQSHAQELGSLMETLEGE